MIKYTVLFFLLLSSMNLMLAQSFSVGHMQKTFVDSSRSNRQIQCEIFYPSTSNGDNTPFANGKFPVIAFGHGFVMPYSVYDGYWNSIVPKGFILIFPTTESSLSPSHTNFGRDLAFVIKAMKEQGDKSTSIFYNSIAGTSAVMGHSMGGGCSFLAMQYDTTITALVSFAAAVTNPSSVSAATGITKPSLVFSGDNDCVAPPKNHQIPMYDSLKSNCKSFIGIIGADHCQFASYNFNCSLGQSTCSPKATISASTQQTLLFTSLIPWLQFTLKNDCIAGKQFQDILSTSSGIRTNQQCTIEFPQPIIQGNAQVCIGKDTVIYTVSNKVGHSYQWLSIRKGSFIGTSNQHIAKIVWNTIGTDTLTIRETDLATGCIKDTTIKVIISDKPQPVIQGDSIVCSDIPAVEYSVTTTDNTSYAWGPIKNGTYLSSQALSRVSISWNKSGIDTITMRQTNVITGCFKDTLFIVRIGESLVPTINGSYSVCIGSENIFIANDVDNLQVQWSGFSKGILLGSDTSKSIKIIWKQPGLDTLRIRISNPQTGCRKDTFEIVEIHENPKPSIVGNSIVCAQQDTSEYFTGYLSTSNYTWKKPRLGKILGSNTGNAIKVYWNSVGIDTIVIREIDKEHGCFKDTSIIVLIRPLPIPIISGKSIVRENDTSLQYRVSANSTSKYKWSIIAGDATLIQDSGSEITINVGKKGNVILNVEELDEYGCKNSQQFEIAVQAVNQIDELSEIDSVIIRQIYNERLIIEDNNAGHDETKYEVISIFGAVIMRGSFNKTIQIPLSSLSSGLYFIRVTTLQGRISKSIVIH